MGGRAGTERHGPLGHGVSAPRGASGLVARNLGRGAREAEQVAGVSGDVRELHRVGDAAGLAASAADAQPHLEPGRGAAGRRRRGRLRAGGRGGGHERTRHEREQDHRGGHQHVGVQRLPGEEASLGQAAAVQRDGAGSHGGVELGVQLGGLEFAHAGGRQSTSSSR